MICAGPQIAAARTLLQWSQTKLAKAAGLSRNAVAYWEAAKTIPFGGYNTPVAVRWIEEALKAAGVRTVVKPYAGCYLIPGEPDDRMPASSDTCVTSVSTGH